MQLQPCPVAFDVESLMTAFIAVEWTRLDIELAMHNSVHDSCVLLKCPLTMSATQVLVGAVMR